MMAIPEDKLRAAQEAAQQTLTIELLVKSKQGFFTPLKPLLDLEDPSKFIRSSEWVYSGEDKLTPEEHLQFTLQINEVLDEAYQELALEKGFTIEKNLDGSFVFKKDNELITTAERLEIEEGLKARCNQIASSKGFNIRMTHNGHVPMLQEKLQQEQQQKEQAQQRFSTPFDSMRTPFKTRMVRH